MKKHLLSPGLRCVVLTLILSFFWTIPSYSQSIVFLADNFIGFDPRDTSYSKEERQIISDFWAVLKGLRENEFEQKRMNGSASFGFNGDMSSTDEIFKVNGGISFSRGKYPAELEFTSDISMVLNNRAFQENVSNLFIAYDFHLPSGDSLWAEPYVFLNRFSDEFLGVDQRYEMGGGVVFAFWSKKLHKDAYAKLAKIRKVKFDPDSFTEDAWYLCSEQYCSKFNLETPSLDDVNALRRAQSRTEMSIKKDHAKYRIGMLVGVFLETEKISASDSLLTANGNKYFTKSFDATQKVRMEFRPTIDLHPTHVWKLKIRPYVKLPMPWRWEETVEKGDFKDTRVDYRVDLQSSLTMSFTDKEDFQSKEVAFGISYRLLYDNAPNRVFLDETGPDMAPLLLSAQKYHHIFQFSFIVGF